MKNITPLHFFFFSLIVYLLVAGLIHFHEFNSADSFWNWFFDEIGKDVLMAMFFTFLYILNNRKKGMSAEDFKTESKRLFVYFFFVSWLFVGVHRVSEAIFTGREIRWILIVGASLAIAIFQVLLAIIFSGVFIKNDKKN